MCLMFFQDKIAKNNNLFSRKKGFQLGNRSPGRTQHLSIALLAGEVYAVGKRTLRKSGHFFNQTIHSLAALKRLG